MSNWKLTLTIKHTLKLAQLRKGGWLLKGYLQSHSGMPAPPNRDMGLHPLTKTWACTPKQGHELPPPDRHMGFLPLTGSCACTHRQGHGFAPPYQGHVLALPVRHMGFLP